MTAMVLLGVCICRLGGRNVTELLREPRAELVSEYDERECLCLERDGAGSGSGSGGGAAVVGCAVVAAIGGIGVVVLVAGGPRDDRCAMFKGRFKGRLPRARDTDDATAAVVVWLANPGAQGDGQAEPGRVTTLAECSTGVDGRLPPPGYGVGCASTLLLLWFQGEDSGKVDADEAVGWWCPANG
jgi:hypothetical protein